MKCPKCGYLGFESGDRCRNCGYDFSLAGGFDLPDLAIVSDEDRQAGPLPDLSILPPPTFEFPPDEPVQTPPAARDVAGAALYRPPEPPPAPVSRARAASPIEDRGGGAPGETPTASEPAGRPASRRDTVEALRRVADERTAKMATGATPGRLPLFADPADADAPLITPPARPRAPLAVRRATPEVPRVRSESRTPTFVERPVAPISDGAAGQPPVAHRAEPGELAGPVPRLLAGAIDVLLLGLLDALVLYFTLQMSGLSLAQAAVLPKFPLAGFLLLLDGGYLAAFAVGGQTIGKMAAGIRVASDDDEPMTVGRALLRTLLWGASAVPLGLGFLSIVASRDRRALHDRFARTRVVTVSSR